MNVHKPRRRRESEPPLVLVVEDEPLVRSYVSDILEQQGFAVLEARTGEEALARVQAGDNDICAVISDVAMPGPLDGFELARRLRHDFPKMGVLLVSGVAEAQNAYLPLGVRFIAKPVRAVTLLRLLREVADPSAKLPPGAQEWKH